MAKTRKKRIIPRAANHGKRVAGSKRMTLKEHSVVGSEVVSDVERSASDIGSRRANPDLKVASAKFLSKPHFFVPGSDEATHFVCDPRAEVETGMHVALVANDKFYATGTLTTKHPQKAKSLTIRHDGGPPGKGGQIGGVSRKSLFRIVGTFFGPLSEPRPFPKHKLQFVVEIDDHVIRPVSEGYEIDGVLYRPVNAVD